MKKQKFGSMIMLVVMMLPLLMACSSDSSEDNYQGNQSPDNVVFFPYQAQQRTLVLGNVSYDNSADNAHMCRINTVMGGANLGKIESVDVTVDESLCDNVWFKDDNGYPVYAITPMPKDYYVLKSNKIYYDGSTGYVDVQLTDAFFNDPKTSTDNTYIISLLMTGITGFGKILTETPNDGLNPPRTDLNAWKEPAKDYTLCCVKYENPWHGIYLRRGIYEITVDGVTTIDVRKDTTLANQYPDFYPGNPVNDRRDDYCHINTKNLKQAIYHAYFKSYDSFDYYCDLILTFNGNSCTITSADENITAQGSGEFIPNGTERPEYKDYQWVSGPNEVHKKCDILRMTYKLDIMDKKIDKNFQVSANDTLVVYSRNVTRKFYEIYYKR